MHQPHALARHGIFIPARQEEGARCGGGREGRLDRHEAVIAVDHHPRPLGARQRGKLLDPVELATAPEQRLADQHHVMPAASRRGEEALGKILERLGGDGLDLEPAVLCPARELAPRRMEFAVARQHAQPLGIAARARRRQPDQEIMRIRREHDRRRIAAPQFVGDMGLRLGPHLAHHAVPLAVGKPRGILPAFDLPGEARVGPQMMAVRGEVQPPGSGAKALREQRLEAHRLVLSDHSSGKARLVSVPCR